MKASETKVYVLIEEKGCSCCDRERNVVRVVSSELAAQMWVDEDKYDREYEEFDVDEA